MRMFGEPARAWPMPRSLVTAVNASSRSTQARAAASTVELLSKITLSPARRVAAAACPIASFSARANCALIAASGSNVDCSLFLDQRAAMRALEVAAFLEMLEIAPHGRDRDAHGIGELLDRRCAALADVIEHDGAALRGDQFGAACRDHALIGFKDCAEAMRGELMPGAGTDARAACPG